MSEQDVRQTCSNAVGGDREHRAHAAAAPRDATDLLRHAGCAERGGRKAVLLATDRGNPYVGKMCDPLTRAVLDAIGMVAEGARRRGIPVSVGGELAGDPAGALLLLGLGVDAPSMSSSSIGRVKQVVRTFSACEAGDLRGDALKAESGDRVREMLEQALEEKGIGSLAGPGR